MYRMLLFTTASILFLTFNATGSEVSVPSTESELREGLLAISSAPPAIKDDYSINPELFNVPADLSFTKQIISHQNNIQYLRNLSIYLDGAFTKSDSASVVRSATRGRDSLLPYILTYDFSSKRAKSLKDEGYLLKDVRETANLRHIGATQTDPGGWTAQACNEQGKCTDVDPIVAIFMMAFDAVVKEFRKDQPFGENNDLTKLVAVVGEFIAQPAGGPDSAFVKARSLAIPQNDQGEVAVLLRDPARRTIEIIEGALRFLNEDNGVVAQALTRPGDVIFEGWDPRPQDNGDIAKAVRDPVNCTIGKLLGRC